MPLLIGAVITLLQGVALAGWGLYDILAPLLDHAANVGRSEYGGAILLLMGLLPLLAGRALLRLRRWGRSPAVLTNSLCLVVAYYMWQVGGAASAGAVAIGLLGVGGIAALLSPRCTRVLYER